MTRIHIFRSRFQIYFFFLVAIINVIRPNTGNYYWISSSSSSSSSKSSSCFFFADAYRVGDVVDADISTRSALTIDLLMANQPLFGLSKTVHLPRLPERFSLSFEEGLHSIPYVDGQFLQHLIVTFVYSKSGGGRIHSVTSKAVQSTGSSRRFDPKRKIEVVFDWIEEENVDIEAGATVMFLAAFIVSILFLLQLCMTTDGYDDEDNNNNDNDNNNRDSYYKGR
jgi:hypothetical protein